MQQRRNREKITQAFSWTLLIRIDDAFARKTGECFGERAYFEQEVVKRSADDGQVEALSGDDPGTGCL